eukprot:g2500.t1
MASAVAPAGTALTAAPAAAPAAAPTAAPTAMPVAAPTARVAHPPAESPSPGRSSRRKPKPKEYFDPEPAKRKSKRKPLRQKKRQQPAKNKKPGPSKKRKRDTAGEVDEGAPVRVDANVEVLIQRALLANTSTELGAALLFQLLTAAVSTAKASGNKPLRHALLKIKTSAEQSSQPRPMALQTACRELQALIMFNDDDDDDDDDVDDGTFCVAPSEPAAAGKPKRRGKGKAGKGKENGRGATKKGKRGSGGKRGAHAGGQKSGVKAEKAGRRSGEVAAGAGATTQTDATVAADAATPQQKRTQLLDKLWREMERAVERLKRQDQYLHFVSAEEAAALSAQTGAQAQAPASSSGSSARRARSAGRRSAAARDADDPVLRGKLQICEGRLVWEGRWAMTERQFGEGVCSRMRYTGPDCTGPDCAAAAPPDQGQSQGQATSPGNASAILHPPVNGEFSGEFELQGSDAGQLERVQEAGVRVAFNQVSDMRYNVRGSGTNKFGAFELRGEYDALSRLLSVTKRYGKFDDSGLEQVGAVSHAASPPAQLAGARADDVTVSALAAPVALARPQANVVPAAAPGSQPPLQQGPQPALQPGPQSQPGSQPESQPEAKASPEESVAAPAEAACEVDLALPAAHLSAVMQKVQARAYIEEVALASVAGEGSASVRIQVPCWASLLSETTAICQRMIAANAPSRVVGAPYREAQRMLNSLEQIVNPARSRQAAEIAAMQREAAIDRIERVNGEAAVQGKARKRPYSRRERVELSEYVPAACEVEGQRCGADLGIPRQGRAWLDWKRAASGQQTELLGTASLLVGVEAEPVVARKKEPEVMWTYLARNDDTAQIIAKKLGVAVADIVHLNPALVAIGFGSMNKVSRATANFASRLSHSCTPNCSTEVARKNGKLTVALHAVRHIEYGEELTIDYNAATDSVQEMRAAVCLCGTRGCNGSFLRFTGASVFNTFMKRNHSIHERFALVCKACNALGGGLNSADDNVVSLSTEQSARLARWGFEPWSQNENRDMDGEASGGAQLCFATPLWLLNWAAFVLDFVERERDALPMKLLGLKMEPRYTATTAIDEARNVADTRLLHITIALDKALHVLRMQQYLDGHQKHKRDSPRRPGGDSSHAGPTAQSSAEAAPLVMLQPEEVVEMLWSGDCSVASTLIRAFETELDEAKRREQRRQAYAAQNNSAAIGAQPPAGKKSEKRKPSAGAAAAGGTKKRKVPGCGDKSGTSGDHTQADSVDAAEEYTTVSPEEFGLRRLREIFHETKVAADDVDAAQAGLLALRVELLKLKGSEYARFDAAADLLAFYSNTCCYFRLHEYHPCRSASVQVKAMEVGGPFASDDADEPSTTATAADDSKGKKLQLGGARMAGDAASSTAAVSTAATAAVPAAAPAPVPPRKDPARVVYTGRKQYGENFLQELLLNWNAEKPTALSDAALRGQLALPRMSSCFSTTAMASRPPPKGQEAPAEDIVCVECKDGNSLVGNEILVCEGDQMFGCSNAYHLQCLDPPLGSVPEGQWFCPTCAPKHRAATEAVKCAKCGDGLSVPGNEILICEGDQLFGCTRAYHQKCLDPPLKEIPSGEWLCPHCVKRKAKLHTEEEDFYADNGVYRYEYGNKARMALLRYLEDKDYRSDMTPWPDAALRGFPVRDANAVVDSDRFATVLGSPMLDEALGHDAAVSEVAKLLRSASGRAHDNERAAEEVNMSNWVQCENPKCLKWRLLPPTVDMEELSGHKFFCHMNRNDVLTDLQTEQLDRSALAVGDWVDCFCPANETWYEARLVVVQDDEVKIHFHKWPTKFDEWMPRDSDRLAPHFSRQWTVSQDWRKREERGSTGAISQKLLEANDEMIRRPGKQQDTAAEEPAAGQPASLADSGSGSTRVLVLPGTG